MAPTATEFEDLEVHAEGDRLVIPVPWRRAEELQNRLLRRGIRSTLFLIPYSSEARIEAWPGADVASVQAALRSGINEG